MANDVPIFDRLPRHESEALLLQAWQQLDQRHRFGIIPCVCRSWYHLSLSTFTSLDLALRSERSVQQLSLWLRHHGSTLRHFSLDLAAIRDQLDLPWGELASAIQSCSSLSGLQLICLDANTLPDMQHLKQLSSLEISSANRQMLSTPQFLESLPRQLESLDLHQSPAFGLYEEDEVHQILRRLVALTRLDVRRTGLPLRYLASCPNLPPLHELKLDVSWQFNCDLTALVKLSCSFLAVEVLEDDLDECVTWCTSQQGKDCLSKLTGMSWSVAMDWVSANGPSSDPCSRAVLSCLATAATGLKDLTLWGCGVLDIKVFSGLRQLTSLCFSYTGPPDADVVSPLAALQKLQKLTVAGLSAMQADAVKAAAVASGKLPSLMKLELKERGPKMLAMV